MLACAHTSLNHIHHIVAKFLALRHDVHIHCADSVSVLVVVDVVDVLRAELASAAVGLPVCQ